jgi:hypothetical protein
MYQIRYDSRFILAILLPLVLFFRSVNPTMTQQTDALLLDLENRYNETDEELFLHYQYAIWEIAYCENQLDVSWTPGEDIDCLH